MTSTPTSSASPSSQLRKRTVQDFSFGQLLGEGSYSSVVEAKEHSTGKSYAIKVLSKRFIIKENKTKYVNVEKQALTLLSRHPFIVKLHYTFQDPTRLFFVIDLAPNGELLHYLRQKGTLEWDAARFYTAEIILAIEHMHKKGVAHRDLKPENILLDHNMHIKITDFGSAKILTEGSVKPEQPGPEGNEERAVSFVGTAEYASPELLEDKDASRGADYWALGCILYQMLVGNTPFKASNDYQIFQRIVALKYDFPEGEDSLPEGSRDLISSLLVRDPESRLGMKDPLALRAHPFFKDKIDWSTLPEQTPPTLGVPPRLETAAPISGFGDLGFHLDESNLPLV